MGKIKSKAIRRSANILEQEGVDFSKDFNQNKKILAKISLGKKIRNQLAGLMTRKKKQTSP